MRSTAPGVAVLLATLLTGSSAFAGPGVLTPASEPHFARVMALTMRDEILGPGVRVEGLSVSGATAELRLSVGEGGRPSSCSVVVEERARNARLLVTKWFSVRIMPEGCPLERQRLDELARALDREFVENPFVPRRRSAWDKTVRAEVVDDDTYGRWHLVIVMMGIALLLLATSWHVLGLRPPAGGRS
jgi:hypothetical protein